MSRRDFIHYLTRAGYTTEEANAFWDKLDGDDITMIGQVIESIQNA